MSEPMVEQSPSARRAQRARLDRESAERRAIRDEGGGTVPLGQPPRGPRRAPQAPRRAPRGFTPQQAAAGYAVGKARDVGRTAARARIVPGDRNYQGIILAEFLVAMLLVALSPIGTGGSPNAKAKGSPSPYDANDLKQLVAVGGAYFVLALLSSGNRGRLAAWLGGLILIAIAMSKASQGKLAGVFTVAAEQPTPEPGPGTSTV